MARPPKLNKEMIDQICVFIENGNTNKDACTMADVSETAFYRWIAVGNDVITGKVRRGTQNKIFVELVESLKKAESKFRAYHISQINTASKKNWQASAWMLERRYPKEFGRNIIEFESENEQGKMVAGLPIVVYLPDNHRDQDKQGGSD